MTEATAACDRFEADLSALLDGELAPERAAEVRAHAEACGPCRGRLARLARVDIALARAPAPELPASLRARLEARLEGARQSDTQLRRAPREAAPRRAWRGRAAGALATAAAGAAVYFAVATREPALDLASVPEEDLDLALEIETVEDLEVIANLELLELVLADDAG